PATPVLYPLSLHDALPICLKSGPWAGMTWLDWAILVLVLSCAVRGFLRGTVAQVFVVLGLLTGAVGGSWVYGWVAEQWSGAEPADRKSTRLNSSHVSISYA